MPAPDMGITEPDLLEAARKIQDLEAELKSNLGRQRGPAWAEEVQASQLQAFWSGWF